MNSSQGIQLNLINFAIALYVLGLLAYLFHGDQNQIVMLISLELILLSIGLILVNQSFHFDDLIGSHQTLYIQPLAGAESAVALAFLVAYFPQRGSLFFFTFRV